VACLMLSASPGEHRPGPRGDGPPGVSVAPAFADSYDHAVRALIRRTRVAVTGMFHFVVSVWVNESSLVFPLQRLIARAEVVA
jgi:hypothetical protein